MRNQLLLTCGRCVVCGCTEEHACDYGCQWTGPSRMYCSQCVCWAVLERPNPYEGILPYGLLPVRSLMPTQSSHRPGLFYPIDFRRIDEEARINMAFIVAPMAGCTVDDVLEHYNSGAFDSGCMDKDKIALVIVGQSVEIAAQRAERFRAFGVFGGWQIDALVASEDNSIRQVGLKRIERL